MGHMITDTDHMFSAEGIEPWHFYETRDGRCIVLANRPKTLEAAIKAAGLTWAVEKVQLYHQFTQPSVTDQFGEMTEAVQDYAEAEGCYAIMRSDTNEILGSCQGRYQPVQNRELFEFAQDIMQAGNEEALWETGGSLFGGKKVWCLIKMPHDFGVGTGDADVVQSYLCVNSSHDGSLSFSSLVTPIRVVCWNTMSLALSQNSGIHSCKHTTNVGDRIAAARTAMGMSVRYMNEFHGIAKVLAAASVTKDQAEDYFAKVFPPIERKDNADPKRVRDNDARPRRLQEISFNLWDHGQTCNLDGISGTAWSALNAASEVQEHALALDTQRQGRRPSAESYWAQNTFGSGLEWRKEALNLALKLAS
jgi:phage/plasmid-like protein (TIGR03299 family)